MKQVRHEILRHAPPIKLLPMKQPPGVIVEFAAATYRSKGMSPPSIPHRRSLKNHIVCMATPPATREESYDRPTQPPSGTKTA
jgi:hypothetical protein